VVKFKYLLDQNQAANLLLFFFKSREGR